MEKKLKIALCILIIVLIALIAFVGVYSKNAVVYESALPDYTLASDVKGKRVTYFQIDTDTEEKIYDKDGNEVDEIPEDANEEDYTKTEEKVNPDEVLTEENYEKAKEIFEGRLKDLGVEDYTVRVSEHTGDAIIELPESLTTDTMLKYLLCKGDFSMTDSADGTLLMDKSDVKEASVVYGNDETGAVVVYLDIKFNSEGKEKLAEVSRTYIKQEEASNDETDTESEEGEDSGNDETTEETTEDTQKKVTMTMEGEEFLTTYFGEEITTGELTISLGSSADTETVYEYATQAQIYAMLLNNDEMPLTYNIKTSPYIESSTSKDGLYVGMAILIVVAVIVIIYMICKYKMDGLLSSVALVAAIAMLILLLRYTKTSISLGGLATILILVAFDVYFMIQILKSIKEDSSVDNVRTTTYNMYLQKMDLIIVLLIIAVVFTFMQEVEVYSIGMTLFYGIISLAISNLVFMRTMLIERHK